MFKKLIVIAAVTAACTLLAACGAEEKLPESTGSLTSPHSEESTASPYEPFTKTLENAEDKERFYKNQPDFLTAEQKELWSRAFYLTYMNVSAENFGFTGDYEKSPRKTADGNEYHYIRTGTDYGEFYSALSEVFTDDFLENTFIGETYINDGGELLFMKKYLEEDISYRSHTYQLISQSGDEIRFKLTAYYSWNGIAQLGNLDKGEAEEHYEEHYFTMVKEDGKWKFSEFDYWL